MTLSKQIQLGFFVILFTVFICMGWFNIQSTRNFIQEQLTSHAQDTATSLGLSITPHLEEKLDFPIAETMIQAIFDRGFYKEISLKDRNGAVIIKLTNPAHTKSVPSWFASIFEIETPIASTEINNGWYIAGELEVTSNVSLAYSQLFRVAKTNLLFLIASLFLTTIFVLILVSKVISKPLNSVVESAILISNRNFTKVDESIKTPELHKITSTFNKMSEKLSNMFYQLSAQSEEYRKFAYVDSVTNLGNRRALELYIQHRLKDKNNLEKGCLAIVKATSLVHINKQFGGKEGDKYLNNLSTIIKTELQKLNHAYSLFRINGSEFVLFIESIDQKTLENVCESIILSSKRVEKSEHAKGHAFMGMTTFIENETLSTILTKADTALTMAIDSEDRYSIYGEKLPTYSNDNWRTFLNSVLAQGCIEFVKQPIQASNLEHVEYEECFARLPKSLIQKEISMSQIVAASMKLDFAIDLDKLIVSNLIEQFHRESKPIGLNLSRFSLLDDTFTNWFIEKLSNEKTFCENLVVEIPERSLMQDLATVVSFTNKLKKLRVRITIEHFGAQLASIISLRKISPDYLKIDGRYTTNICSHQDNQLFVSSLISIAKGLSISVIAERIETSEDKNWLENSGIDFIQGYLIGIPK